MRWLSFVAGLIGVSVAEAVNPAPPTVHVRAVSWLDVAPIAGRLAGALPATSANIVFDRLDLPERDRFDLVLATNVFVYCDTFEQTLALASIASMLRPGGILLTNDAVLEIPEIPLRRPRRRGPEVASPPARPAEGRRRMVARLTSASPRPRIPLAHLHCLEVLMFRTQAWAFVLLLSCTALMAGAEKLTPAELLKRHLAQQLPGIGQRTGHERDVRGACTVTTPAKGAGLLGGSFSLASSAQASRLTMQLQSDVYEGESFTVKGNEVEIGFAQPRTTSRSALGVFVSMNKGHRRFQYAFCPT